MRALRTGFQLFFVLSALYLGVGFVHGWTTSSVERYCPLGGLATSYSLLFDQHLTCATSVFNVSLVVALLLLTLVARKAFCSWICPIGTLSEWIGSAVGRVSSRLSKARKRRRANSGANEEIAAARNPRRARRPAAGLLIPSRSLDRPLRWLRLPILALVLGFSFVLAELVFRPFCPYYVGFSMNGHEVQPWSYAVAGGLLLLLIVVPMAWCRYLCPLGGALWPFSRVGRLRLRRDAQGCTSCRACDRACPHSLPISTSSEVTSGECTLCLECTRACRVDAKPLTLHASRTSRRPLNGAVVPGVILAAIVAGVVAANLIAIPSYSQTFAGAEGVSEQARRSVALEVEGVRCVDTARRAAAQLDGLPGVLELTAYASERELIVTYDAGTIDVAGIVEAIEGPVYDEERQAYFFNVYDVVAIDGGAVE